MASSPDDRPAIEFRRVSYRLNGTSEIIRDLNLEIRRGETLVLLGRSGSGKTTTLKIINALVRPTSGEVLGKFRRQLGRESLGASASVPNFRWSSQNVEQWNDLKIRS